MIDQEGLEGELQEPEFYTRESLEREIDDPKNKEKVDYLTEKLADYITANRKKILGLRWSKRNKEGRRLDHITAIKLCLIKDRILDIRYENELQIGVAYFDYNQLEKKTIGLQNYAFKWLKGQAHYWRDRYISVLAVLLDRNKDKYIGCLHQP
ncbi:hypothetical protein ACFLZB_04855 [Nanoarchaeota archaeon]